MGAGSSPHSRKLLGVGQDKKSGFLNWFLLLSYDLGLNFLIHKLEKRNLPVERQCTQGLRSQTLESGCLGRRPRSATFQLLELEPPLCASVSSAVTWRSYEYYYEYEMG